MAFVMLPVSLSWPVFLAASLALVTALLVIWMEPKDRRVTGMVIGICLAGPAVVISDQICQMYPWLLECWCRWCL